MLANAWACSGALCNGIKGCHATNCVAFRNQRDSSDSEEDFDVERDAVEKKGIARILPPPPPPEHSVPTPCAPASSLTPHGWRDEHCLRTCTREWGGVREVDHVSFLTSSAGLGGRAEGVCDVAEAGLVHAFTRWLLSNVPASTHATDPPPPTPSAAEFGRFC